MAGMKEAHRIAPAHDVTRHIAVLTASFATGQMIGPVFASSVHDLTGSFSVSLLVTSVALLVTSDCTDVPRIEPGSPSRPESRLTRGCRRYAPQRASTDTQDEEFVLPFSLEVAQLAERTDIEPDGRERVEVGKSHDRLEGNAQFEELVANLGRRQGLTLIEVEPPLGNGRGPGFRGVEDIERSVVPTSAGPPAGERVAPFADRTPHPARVGRPIAPFQSVEQSLIADAAHAPAGDG